MCCKLLVDILCTLEREGSQIWSISINDSFMKTNKINPYTSLQRLHQANINAMSTPQIYLPLWTPSSYKSLQISVWEQFEASTYLHFPKFWWGVEYAQNYSKARTKMLRLNGKSHRGNSFSKHYISIQLEFKIGTQWQSTICKYDKKIRK